MAIKEIISEAIKKADTSYFYEDYMEQAIKVLIELKKQGLVIVPSVANMEMTKSGVNAIMYGHLKPEQVVNEIYSAMIKSYKG